MPKRALVLSGGGSKGAYEAGVVKYLLDVEKSRYDIFCGVSVGALNSAFLAQFEDQSMAAAALLTLWDDLDDSKVYKNWTIPYISALWKPSVYDSSPLQQLVRNRLDRPAPGRKLRIGATALDTGRYVVFNELEPNIPNAVLASSAFPGMLTPVELWDKQLYTDGGVRSNTPLNTAIDAGADEVDVVLCSPSTDESTSFKTGNVNVLEVAKRAIDLMSDQIQENDLEVCRMKNDHSELSGSPYRYVKLRVVRPTQTLLDNPLDFSPDQIQRMIKVGILDATTQLRGQHNA